MKEVLRKIIKKRRQENSNAKRKMKIDLDKPTFKRGAPLTMLIETAIPENTKQKEVEVLAEATRNNIFYIQDTEMDSNQYYTRLKLTIWTDITGNRN